MISILVPSRKRPGGLKRLYYSARKTAQFFDDIEFVVYVDEDDTSYEKTSFPNMKFIKGPRIVLSEMWNRCYEKAKGPIYMHCGDDIIFRTPNWDTVVRQEFEKYPDKIVFVYGNDGSGVHDGKFGTHGFIHRNWVQAVGYFVPPYFSSDFNDTWLNDVAKMIGRHNHIDILTEHMHPDLGKGKLDITHRDRLDRHKRDNVNVLYESKIGERVWDAQKLSNVIGE